MRDETTVSVLRARFGPVRPLTRLGGELVGQW